MNGPDAMHEDTGAAATMVQAPVEASVAAPREGARWGMWLAIGLVVVLLAMGAFLVFALGNGLSGSRSGGSDDMETLLDEDYAGQPDRAPVAEEGLTWELKGGQLLLTAAPGEGWQPLWIDVPAAGEVVVEATIRNAGTSPEGTAGVGVFEDHADEFGGVVLACHVGEPAQLIDAQSGAALLAVGDQPCGDGDTLTLRATGGSGPAMIIAEVGEQSPVAFFGTLEMAHMEKAGVFAAAGEAGYVVGVDEWSVQAK